MRRARGRVCFSGKGVREVAKFFVAHVRRFKGGFESSRRRKAVTAVVVIVVASVAVNAVITEAVAIVAGRSGGASGSPADYFENGQDSKPGGWVGRRDAMGWSGRVTGIITRDCRKGTK